MSFVHGRQDQPYPRNQEFTKKELFGIQPSDVVAYLNLKAFDYPWSHEDACPMSARAGSLKKAKMPISWFMPKDGVPWMERRGSNPTRHITINAAIKKIEKLETQGLGMEVTNDTRAYINLLSQGYWLVPVVEPSKSAGLCRRCLGIWMFNW
jgi:hypothetical protein